MKDNKGLFIGLAVLAVIVIAGVAAMAVNSGNKNSNSGSYGGDKTSTSKTTDSTKPAAGDSTSSSSTTNAVEANTVTIKDYKFDAPAIKVKVGTTVTWTNMDGVRHNVSPDSPSADFPDGKLIGNGETYSFTFAKAGTYSYHCTPHPYMKGTVVVTQ